MMTAKQKEALKKMYHAAGDFLATFGVFDDPVEEPDANTAEQTENMEVTEVVEKAIHPAVKAKREHNAKPEYERIPDTTDAFTRESLEKLGYNDMKALAKKLGLKAVGDRETIISLILNARTPDKTAEPETPPANKATKPGTTTPRGKKVEIPESKEPPFEVKEDEEDIEVDGDEVDFEAMVIEATKDMSDEELLEYLTENKIKAKGKRQALIAATVKAVRDGLLELEDDGEEPDDTTENESDGADIEDDREEEFDLDEINDLENPNMTEERAASIEALTADINSQFKKKELTVKDLTDFINDYFGDKDHSEGLKEIERLKLYTDLACLFINDDGEMPEENADPEVYTVNGDAYCCGHPCLWDEDSETYVCETCGGEYKPEEE